MKTKILSVLGALAILVNATQVPALQAQTGAPPESSEPALMTPSSPSITLANCKESLTPVPAPAGVTTGRIAPSVTNPNTAAPDCPHYVALSTTARRQPELFVFLPGTNLEPLQFKMIVHQAAQNGYYAIGLSYPNLISENEACSKPLANLPEDPQCSTDFREEVITGVDVSSVVTVTQANSIMGRLTALITYLNVNDPANNWGQFLQNGKPAWSKIRLGGHSQGSGHTALIGTKLSVARACMFSGPSDSARYGLNPPPAGEYSSFDYSNGVVTVTLYSLPPTWVTSTTATPAQLMYSFRMMVTGHRNRAN